MSILITGVAGFIGSNLARHFVAEGRHVVGLDNLCRGSLRNLETILEASNFEFSHAEIADQSACDVALRSFHDREPIDEVWHLAANSDIPAGVEDALVDYRDTFMTTFNILQAMKTLRIRKIAFASSSAVYGDKKEEVLSETTGPLLPVSNYGAMKLASEAAISAAVEAFLDRAWLFRFPNVIGTPATHGVILDFIGKLAVSPNRLDVLGNGSQQKGYLHVADLVAAMRYVHDRADEKLALYNIGAGDEGATVQFIAEETVRQAGGRATIFYGEGAKGWVGDVPRFAYSVAKLDALGWTPSLGSADAVRRAVSEILIQERGR